jgi:hypothetical protein
MSSTEGFLRREGKLYQLLCDRFPEHRSKQSVLDIPRLCVEMGFANETIYRCVRTNHMRVKVARRFLQFSHENYPETALVWDDLTPFILLDFDRYSALPDAGGGDDDLL